MWVNIMSHTAAIKHSFQQMSRSVWLREESLSKCACIHVSVTWLAHVTNFFRAAGVCECVCTSSSEHSGCDSDSEWQLKPGHWRVSIHLLVYVSFYLPPFPPHSRLGNVLAQRLRWQDPRLWTLCHAYVCSSAPTCQPGSPAAVLIYQTGAAGYNI